VPSAAEAMVMAPAARATSARPARIDLVKQVAAMGWRNASGETNSAWRALRQAPSAAAACPGFREQPFGNGPDGLHQVENSACMAIRRELPPGPA